MFNKIILIELNKIKYILYYNAFLVLLIILIMTNYTFITNYVLNNIHIDNRKNLFHFLTLFLNHHYFFYYF